MVTITRFLIFDYFEYTYIDGMENHQKTTLPGIKHKTGYEIEVQHKTSCKK